MLRDEFNQLFFQFIGDTHKVAYELSNEFQPEGISQIEYGLLEHLYYFERQHLNDMSNTLLISKNTSRKYLKRLVDLGFVDAGKDENDGRKKVYAITRNGKLKLDECFFQVIKGVQEKYKHINEETLTNVIECITYVTKVLYEQQ